MDLEDIWRKLQRHDQDNQWVRRDLEAAEANARLVISDAEVSVLIAHDRRAAPARGQLANAPPDDPRVKQELEAIAAEGDQAVQRLHQGHQWPVMQVAGEYLAGGLKFTDLMERGSAGLSRAIQTFHHMRHCRFQDYATVWIERLISLAAAQGNNGIDMLPWANLAHLQATRQMVLGIRLGRNPTYAELATTMGYLTARDAAEIMAARRAGRSPAPELAQKLAVAKAKVECLYRLPEVMKEFGRSKQVTVTVEGEPHIVDAIVSVILPAHKLVETFHRCGYSPATHGKGVWLCYKCLKAQNFEGCGRYRAEPEIYFGRGRLPPTVELYDGQRFNIEDDPWTFMRGAFF